MSTVTIRLPDPKHERLKQLAKARKIGVNKLIRRFGRVRCGDALSRPGDPR
jgi:ribbon-helix-helix CopG family protein